MRILNLFVFLFLFAYSLNAQQPKLILPIGHTNQILRLNVSENEKKIYALDWDGFLKVWDAASAAMLLNITDRWFEMSPDRKIIITYPADSIKLWDANTAKVMHQRKVAAGNVNKVCINSNGSRICTLSGDSILTLWQAPALLPLFQKQISGNIISLNFSQDNKKIFARFSDKTVKIWEASTGKELLRVAHYKYVMEAYMPSGINKLVTVTEDSVFVWDTNSGNLLHKHEGYRTAFTIDNKYLFIATPQNGLLKIDIHTGAHLLTLETGEYNYLWAIVLSADGKLVATASSDHVARLWNLATGELVRVFEGHTKPVTRLIFSKTGEKIFTGSDDYTIKTWDVKNGKIALDIKRRTHIPWTAFFHCGQQEIMIGFSDSTIGIWDAATGVIRKKISGYSAPVKYAEYNMDCKKIIAVIDSSAQIRDAETGQVLVTVKDNDYVQYAHFSSDTSLFITVTYHHVKVWSTLNGRLLNTIKGHTGIISNAGFSKNGKQIITAATDSLVAWRDAVTGELIKGAKMTKPTTFIALSTDEKTTAIAGSDYNVRILNLASMKYKTLQGHQADITYISYNNSNDKIVTASYDKTAIIWDLATGKIIQRLTGHENFVVTASFSPDGNTVLTTSRDNMIKLWNVKTGKCMNSFFVIDSVDYLNLLPDGYYYGSTAGIKKLHYVTNDLKVISFEQLDIKYNRPDKVLEAIGNTDTALINSYKQAYYKRIKKLGIDTTQFNDGYSVPEADFVNRDEIEYEQKNGQLRLRIKGSDSNYKLDRFNIWVNEVPLFGMKGISIKNRKSNYFDTTVSISLSQGENRIETSISNVNGTESYRMPIYVKYTPIQPAKETVHFIGIGINQFKDSKHNLQWCVKDIRDLALKFKEKYGSNIIIDTLFDQNVTLSNVRALKQKMLNTKINDKVIIAYSGHGLLSKQYDYYLSSYTVNFSKPEENGIAYEEIENLLDGIPARKKLLLLDACHSGEVDKEEMLVMQTAKTKAGNSGLIMNRGSEEETTETKTVGLQNSFELMQSLFVNVGKGTGATIISAAGGVQFAQERNDLKNGVFTFSLLEAMMQNKNIKVSELKKYVGQRVEQLTNGLQKPTTRNELKDFDWDVW